MENVGSMIQEEEEEEERGWKGKKRVKGRRRLKKRNVETTSLEEVHSAT